MSINSFVEKKKIINLKNTLFFSLILGLGLIVLPNNSAQATSGYDDAAGTYADNFADASGVPESTRSYVNVNTGIGKLQLTDSDNQTTFLTPYRASGSAVTGEIRPLLMAKWGTVTFTRNVPVNTTLKVQILDMCDNIYPDSYVTGNSTGIETSTIDISNVPVLHNAANSMADCENDSKSPTLKIKFLMTTSDTLVTPTVDDLVISWTKTQGDLSPSGLDSSAPWPVDTVDQNGTNHSSYINSQTYPAFKWAKTYERDNQSGGLFVLSDKIISSSNNQNGYFFALDRDTGQEFWKINAQYINYSSGGSVVSNNGTYYGASIWSDTFYAINTNNGQIKWVYNFRAGHGNTQTSLAADGTIYTIRYDNNIATLYAFNPNGSIKWQKTYTISPNVAHMAIISSTVIGSDGTIYFVAAAADSEYQNTDQGGLYAIDPADGSIKWKYSAGSLQAMPIINSDGTIYIASRTSTPTWPEPDYIMTCNTSQQKVWAINSDGSLKWEKVIAEDKGCWGYMNFSLRSDGVLLGVRDTEVDGVSQYKIEAIATSDGTLQWSRNILSGVARIFTDSDNGLFYIDGVVSGANAKAQINYYDSVDNFKWKISYPYNSSESESMFFYNAIAQDERGWLFGGFAKYAFNGVENNYAKPFALAPWTLTDSSNNSIPKVGGNVLNFTVATSMIQANPLLGGDNKVQVIMDNDEKVLLSYDSTNEDGNTVWTGSYTLPVDMVVGEHNYTIEASQSYLQTDTATHFDSAPTESNNTGIIATGNFQVTDSVVINDPIGDDMLAEVLSGRISIQGFDPTAIDNFTFNNNYTFTAGEYSVFIPTGTVVTSSDGGKIDLTKFITEDLSATIGLELDNTLGSIRFGISGAKLSFSQPITITIPVGQENNGRTLQIIFQREGENDWNDDVTCLVANGNCVFQTNHSTTFVAEEIPDRAEVDSWTAYEYAKPDTSCVQRLKVSIKGSHFAKDAEVEIGGRKALSVDRKSSKELTAKFCLSKLLNTKTDLKRTISVTNPDTKKTKAKKEINLSNILTSIPDNLFNAQTIEGIKNIQKILVKEGFLEEKYIMGIYGPLTQNAVKAFQKKHNLPQTGVVGPQTKKELEKS